MTSCRVTSIVTTRRSILTMRSTIGMRKMSPGPFAPSNLPRRKMTPRSYSRRTRTAWGRIISASTNTGTSQLINLANSSNIRSFSAFRFNSQRQSLYGEDLNVLALFDQAFAYGVPVFSINKNLPAVHIDRSKSTGKFSQHYFSADLYRHSLSADTLGHDEDKKRCSHDNTGQDVTKRKSEKRIASVKKHQRADEKWNDPASR